MTLQIIDNYLIRFLEVIYISGIQIQHQLENVEQLQNYILFKFSKGIESLPQTL